MKHLTKNGNVKYGAKSQTTLGFQVEPDLYTRIQAMRKLWKITRILNESVRAGLPTVEGQIKNER